MRRFDLVKVLRASVTLWVLFAGMACFSGDPKILFVSEAEGRKPEIFVLDPDSGSTGFLTAGDDEEEQRPTLSPDGTRVAFVIRETDTGETGLLVVTPVEVKSDLRKIIGIDRNVTGKVVWSPEGDRLAFVSEKQDGTEVFVALIEGGPAIRVTENQSVERLGDWSPDGEWLVFAATGGPDGPGLWLRNVNGVNTIRLTRGNDSSPVWSPDGRRIVFVRAEAGNTDIYGLTRPRGSTWRDPAMLTRLTQTPEPERSPAWSPNSKALAMVSNRDGNSEIYTMNSDGSKQKRLTHNGDDDLHPVWSPDGKKSPLFLTFTDPGRLSSWMPTARTKCA